MAEYSATSEFVISVGDLARSLSPQIPLIAACAFVALVLAMAVTATVTPLYEGRAVVAIDLRNRNPVEVSTQIEALRTYETSRAAGGTGRCSYQERNGVVTIRCEAETSAGAFAAVKHGLAEIVALGSDQGGEWARLADSLREIKATYEANELAIIGRGTATSDTVSATRGLHAGTGNSPTLAMIQLSQAAMFEKIVRLEIAMRRVALFPPRIVVEPRVSDAPLRPHWVRNAVFAVLLGAMTGVLVALARVFAKRKPRRTAM